MKITAMNLFDEFGLENCKIELLENFPCDNKEQLRQREGHYIRNNDCVNKRIECRTREEYRDEHKEDMRKYRIEHKEQIAQKAHEYWINNKERKNELNVRNTNVTYAMAITHQIARQHMIKQTNISMLYYVLKQLG